MPKYTANERLIDRGTITEKGAVVELTAEQAAALGSAVTLVPQPKSNPSPNSESK